MRAGDGDNVVTVQELSVEDDLVVTAGSGNFDSITVQHLRVGDDLNVHAGDGDANITVQDLWVGDDLKITAGDANTLSIINVQHLSFRDNLFIVTGGRNDQVNIQDAHILQLNVQLSGGDDDLFFNNVHGGVANLDGGSGDNTLSDMFWFATVYKSGF